MEDNDTLCVGIDLGTSRCSVSASNGERHVVDSYVGWPLDMVARKVDDLCHLQLGHQLCAGRASDRWCGAPRL